MCLIRTEKTKNLSDEHFQRLYNDDLVRRFIVPPNQFSWENNFRDYKPVSFTDKSILSASFADPADPLVDVLPFNGWDEKRKRNRMTFDPSRPFKIDRGLPLNPIGRTGINGRGKKLLIYVYSFPDCFCVLNS